MLAELLSTGRENAKTSSELQRLLKCAPRDISNAAERERRSGKPICATSGRNPGYFLAANEKELEDYCGRLRHRAGEIFKTRKALMMILKKGKEQEALEQNS